MYGYGGYDRTYPSPMGEFIHVPNEQVGRNYQVFPGNTVRMIDDSLPNRMYIKAVSFATKQEDFRIINMVEEIPQTNQNDSNISNSSITDIISMINAMKEEMENFRQSLNDIRNSLKNRDNPKKRSYDEKEQNNVQQTK